MSSGHRNAKNHRNTLNSLTDTTRDAAEQVKDDAASMGRHVREAVSETAGAVRNAASEKADELREMAGDYYDAGVRRVRDFEGTLEDRIRAKPLAAIGIAAGLGLLVGMVCLRRH